MRFVMKTITDKMDLSQKVALYYFVFGLIGLLGLSAGIAYATHQYLTNRADSQGLAMVGQATPRVLLQLIQDDAPEIKKIVDDIHRKQSLIYVSIVGPNGKILHHTDSTQVGTLARKAGQLESWGEIQVATFNARSDIPLREYRSPLTSGKRNFGTLRLATLRPSMWSALSEAYEYLLLALLIPAVILGLGAFVLRRVMAPMTAIEQQLRLAAQSQSCSEMNVSELPTNGRLATGWNKIVQSMGQHDADDSEKIKDAVTNYRRNQVFDILDSLPDGVAITDHKNSIKMLNKSFLNLFADSISEDESLIGQNIFDHVYGSQSALEPGTNENLGVGGAIEEVVRNDGNEERILRVARHKLRCRQDASSQSLVWTVRDITQYKLTEKMRDEFLDSATHELRTPLSNIKAYAETLAISEVLDVEQQKEFCNTINSEATRLARFIDDLLSISNVEAGSLAITRDNVEVDRMMRDVVDKVKPLMAQKEIEFNVNLPQKRLPALFIDKDKIQVALVNLLGNAGKYTANGGRVDVNVKLADEQIYFSVEDTGIGISEEDLPKLFDKFYRSDDYAVQEETGTGLGLSLAKEIVQLHGGRILVESTLGKGSKFTVKLPARTGVLV